MTEDKKTVHLIIWLGFLCGMFGFILHGAGLLAVVFAKRLGADPSTLAISVAAGAGFMGATQTGLFALLARTRTDTASVTVENTTEHPVPTEPQPPIAPQAAPEPPQPPQTDTAPIEPVSPEDALPEPPPVAIRN